MISRFSLLCLTLIAAGPAFAGSVKTPDCESEIDEVEISDAEGQQRLDAMNTPINVCAAQYKRDKKIASLVRECAKYEGPTHGATAIRGRLSGSRFQIRELYGLKAQ
jgi:hypothetical protein